MSSQERAKRQSTDEWIEEFSTGQPVTPKQEQSAPYKPWIRDAPAEAVGNLQIIKQRTLAYDTHRTTSSNGHLILIFTDSETGDEVAAFFNVDIRQQRGIGKGQANRTGHRGKFYPPPRSKFRKFWMECIGEEPIRWALAHKFLKARLKSLLFTGVITEELRKDRRTGKQVPYLKVTDVTKVEQSGHKLVTSS